MHQLSDSQPEIRLKRRFYKRIGIAVKAYESIVFIVNHCKVYSFVIALVTNAPDVGLSASGSQQDRLDPAGQRKNTIPAHIVYFSALLRCSYTYRSSACFFIIIVPYCQYFAT